MSTKKPFYVSPPTDFQSFGSGKFQLSYGGTNIKISLNGGSSWQKLPPYTKYAWASPKLYSDLTVNQTSLMITMDEGEIWRIMSIRVNLDTTATVGNRRVSLGIRDGSQYIFSSSDTTDVPASSSNIHHYFHASDYKEDSVSGLNNAPIPPIILLPGYQIYMYETSSTDGNDDMRFFVYYQRMIGLDTKEIIINADDLLVSWSESTVSGSEQTLNVFKLD
jgi:hypothetical protein